MAKYTAVTFAPVQGFIEKSRKLRDLYGASLILSYLSQTIASYVNQQTDLELISPALPNLQKGMPNRILMRGEMSQETARDIIISAWKEVLKICREWIETEIQNSYYWEREWNLWGSHTWEIFRGVGDSIAGAMNDLETKKLSRDWSAINWIGESSSLTGTDGIAFPELGASHRNPKNLNYGWEDQEIRRFYEHLARVTENEEEENPEGKFIALNEKLSIPELVKRLVTWKPIQQKIGIESLHVGFREIQRKPTETTKGQWTGWFMGDGDRVGAHLQQLASGENADSQIKNFSQAMRKWGKRFDDEFNLRQKLGRVVYAGGDDFLGIIYSDEYPREKIAPSTAYQWLQDLPNKWQKHEQKITLSVGFVWVAGSVPQRDVLQHCREAEKTAKSLGRDRVTIRVAFNSGQYIQWTCPWDYLDILDKYRDREQQSNWSHIYQDLAYLESRRAFTIETPSEARIVKQTALEFFDLYFPGEGKKLIQDSEKQKEKFAQHLSGYPDGSNEIDRAKAIVDWITDLVKVGWHLCSNT